MSSAVQEIKAKLNLADIVRRYVDLKHNGTRLVAPCPFHQETKPSFSVNEEEGFFYCFGCQASGDLFEFYSKINGLDFKETLEQLAEEAGVRLEGRKDTKTSQAPSKRKHFLQMYELAANYFKTNLQHPEGAECLAYLQQRGVSEEVCQTFGVGFSLRGWQGLCNTLQKAGFKPDLQVESQLVGRSNNGNLYDRFRGRLMFPIKNLSNQVIAFGGRIIGQEDEAKYINSSDSLLYKKGDNLYGLAQARRSISAKQSAMLTEGYMDVITLHQFGYTNAMGVLGTAFTPEQVKRIIGFTSKVELLFDGDAPGRKAALRACEMLLSQGINCKVVLFPEGEDIDSLLRKLGPEAFDKLRASAHDGLNFCINSLRNQSPKDAILWTRNFLQQIELPELVSSYATKLGHGLDISEKELRESLTHPAKTQNLGEANQVINAKDREILTFIVRYPESLPKMLELGAELALSSNWSKNLWHKFAQAKLVEDAIAALEPSEKRFWTKCRITAPLDREEIEFQAIKTMLEKINTLKHSRSIKVALSQGASTNFATDLEYLRVLQANLEKIHGQ